MSRSSCNDNDFGPAVHGGDGCRDDFDFTLLFENTILSILPSLLALLFATGRLFFLRSKPKLLRARRFQLSKLVRDDPLMHIVHSTYQQERQRYRAMRPYKLPWSRCGLASRACARGLQLSPPDCRFSMP